MLTFDLAAAAVVGGIAVVCGVVAAVVNGGVGVTVDVYC